VSGGEVGDGWVEPQVDCVALCAEFLDEALGDCRVDDLIGFPLDDQ
jgi:hypothetical protein